MGWILTILLGVAGSGIGRYLAGMLGLTSQLIGFLVSIACAVALLFLYKLLRKKKP